MRRALICFVSVQGLMRMGHHHRVADLRWPCTAETIADISAAMEVDVGYPIALTSLTWLEPEPG